MTPTHLDAVAMGISWCQTLQSKPEQYCQRDKHRVTWGKAPPFGDDLSLTYLFASTSEKSYMYVTNYMLCV